MSDDVKPFISAVAALMRALAECHNLPAPVMDAADDLARAVTALGGRDVGPPPG